MADGAETQRWKNARQVQRALERARAVARNLRDDAGYSADADAIEFLCEEVVRRRLRGEEDRRVLRRTREQVDAILIEASAKVAHALYPWRQKADERRLERRRRRLDAAAQPETDIDETDETDETNEVGT